MSAIRKISPMQLAALDSGSVVILDVRTPVEHQDVRLARHHAFVPLDSLVPADFALRHGIEVATPIYTVCSSGARSQRAAEMLQSAGFTEVYSVDGGLSACKGAGMSLEGPGASAFGASGAGGPLPMERQVRIGAGTLAALGAALGLFVHPVFTCLSLFVGLGLVYAGVTNKCGMALLLTKAPWNKGASCGGGVCPIGGPSAGASGGGCH